jgi:hypothetical protein
MSPQAKKLTIAIVLVVVAVGMFVMFRGPKLQLSNSIDFVCIETGKIYALNRDKIPAAFPAKNPDTGHETLFPVLIKDGKTYADPHYAYGMLTEPEIAKVNKYVDPQTYEVLASPRQ